MLPESAARYDIARTLGDTRVLRLTRRQSRGGPVVDCTGMTASLTLYDRGGGTLRATLSTANGGIAALGTSGVIAIDLGHTEYAALPAGVYAYRLDVVESGETRPLLRGAWRIAL